MDSPLDLSVIVPVFNEQDVLPLFHHEILGQLEASGMTWEVVYVDDGSHDDTRLKLKEIRSACKNVSLTFLSRNFGKESAMSAGLKVARGDACIIMDVDLQDPPELIHEMIKAWRDGADIVNMRRKIRYGESWVKITSANLFYRLMNFISNVKIQEGVGDFRLLSRRVVDALNALPENNRFMKGLFSWVGYKQVVIEFDRPSRAAGKSKWNYWKLWQFALEGITSFSSAPLKVSTYVGLLTSLGAFAFALLFFAKTLITGSDIPGFPTLIIVILMLGGVQLMAIGLLGEYVGRLFMECKRRPLFLVEEFFPSEAAEPEICHKPPQA